jgi:conjugative relaxase-like TrwC/TraI family protein
MFSGIPQKNRQAADEYYDQHLSHNDYYSEGQKQRGEWIGLGAEQLGLKPGGAVNREAYSRLCDNQHPLTGKQLTPHNFEGRRIYFDFVCSPPKSVSILAVTMDDRRIVEAHEAASKIALRELETFAAARIRKNGVEDKDRVTGNLVGAAFTHTTSRALDPQLHTHFVLFNTTWDKRERRWKALQTGGMYGAINYGTEVYRNELAKRLHKMGYAVRRTASAFEIEGVDSQLIERFSKRSQQRDLAVKRREEEVGRKLSKKEVAYIVRQTRAKKVKDIDDEQVRKQHLGEIGFFEKRALRKVVDAANGTPTSPPQQVTETAAVEHGVAHVFERQSVVPQHKILEAALIKGCGQLDLDWLKRKLAEDERLVRVGLEYSTRDILNKELMLIRSVNHGLNTVKPVVNRYEGEGFLAPDQRKALSHVLTSPDRITGFRGLAGSGKSTTLAELSRALKRQGFVPVFCAPTASAADTLRQESLRTATTLQRLLTDSGAQQSLDGRSVIVLDEAGAVGLDDMLKLFDLVQLRDCRVVLSGDTGQHSSVPRGDALRIIEQYSSYRFSELTTIRRQKPADFREVVKLAAAKDTDKAFARLVEMGAVIETLNDKGQLYDKAAEAYITATKQGKSVLLVSPTWTEIEAVTDKLRETLKAQGTLGRNDETVPVFDSFSWTEAQKKNGRQYEPGQRLRFLRQTKMFERGEMVEIIGQPVAAHNMLRVRRADGAETLLKLGAGSACFDVGQSRELKVAAGDWLLLQANHGKEFINGERVQIKAIENGKITLTDDRALPPRFNAFTHGYAVTSHSSQGKTVDEVLLVASSKSFPAVTREQFYVSISRGRERVQVFTDDSELLAHRVKDSQDRKAAVELTELRQELAKLGFTRREPETGESSSEVARHDFRMVRPMRSIMASRPDYPQRATRLSPVQRLAQIIEDMRRWLGFGEAQNVGQESQNDQQISAITPEASRLRQTVPPPRRSRGMRI